MFCAFKSISTRVIFVVILLLQIDFVALSQSTNINNNTHKFKVVRIKDVGNAYTISLERDDNTSIKGLYYNHFYRYTVISLKSKTKKELPKIKNGKHYNLTLESIDGYILYIGDFRKGRLSYVINNDTISFINKEYYNNIPFVVSPSIEGLYYKECIDEK